MVGDLGRRHNKMSTQHVSQFYRPLVGAVAATFFVRCFLVVRGREMTFVKVALVGGWFLIGAGVVGIAQLIRKKEFSWIGSVLAVVGVTILVAVIMLGLKQVGLIG